MGCPHRRRPGAATKLGLDDRGDSASRGRRRRRWRCRYEASALMTEETALTVTGL